MTQMKPPETGLPEQHDPYKLRSLEQILALFDGGDFMTEVMDGHRKLQIELLEHAAEHGSKGCDGTMTIKIGYALGKSGDVSMSAKAEFKGPKKPPSSAAAFINDRGELTLYSPFLARMHQPVRDATPHDPETGEVRDV